jgi:hypothetical protein
MATQNATTKAYEEKLSAQLQQAKAQLGEFEARDKGKMLQGEIETISHLKAKQQEIEKKYQALKSSGAAKLEQLKAQIDPEMAELKMSLEQLATKLKVEPRAKAS